MDHLEPQEREDIKTQIASVFKGRFNGVEVKIGAARNQSYILIEFKFPEAVEPYYASHLEELIQQAIPLLSFSLVSNSRSKNDFWQYQIIFQDELIKNKKVDLPKLKSDVEAVPGRLAEMLEAAGKRLTLSQIQLELGEILNFFEDEMVSMFGHDWDDHYASRGDLGQSSFIVPTERLIWSKDRFDHEKWTDDFYRKLDIPVEQRPFTIAIGYTHHDHGEERRIGVRGDRDNIAKHHDAALAFIEHFRSQWPLIEQAIKSPSETAVAREDRVQSLAVLMNDLVNVLPKPSGIFPLYVEEEKDRIMIKCNSIFEARGMADAFPAICNLLAQPNEKAALIMILRDGPVISDDGLEVSISRQMAALLCRADSRQMAEMVLGKNKPAIEIQ